MYPQILTSFTGTRSSICRQEAKEEVVKRKGYVANISRRPSNLQLLRHFKASSAPDKIAWDSMLTFGASDSQGQGQPCRRPRQSHLRQTLQRRPILPPHHRSHTRRQIEDQWKLSTEGAE